MSRQNDLPSEITILHKITSLLSRYIDETDPYVLFNGILDELLVLTDSEYGFIADISYSSDNGFLIRNYAITDIAWNKEAVALYKKHVEKKGMIFSNNLNTLYGEVIKSGEAVITNHPATDPRSGGLPAGHPKLNSFMGMPIYGKDEILGLLGIANRPAGYHKALADSLHPFLVTCGNLIRTCRTNRKNLQVELELNLYRNRIMENCEVVSLGKDYEFNLTQPNLTKDNQVLSLTKKELFLLEQLVRSINRIITHKELEKAVWQNAVVSESSLRSLVKRLRKKAPELDIISVSGLGYLLKSHG